MEQFVVTTFPSTPALRMTQNEHKHGTTPKWLTQNISFHLCADLLKNIIFHTQKHIGACMVLLTRARPNTQSTSPQAHGAVCCVVCQLQIGPRAYRHLLS